MLVAGLYNGNVAVYNLQVKISALLEVKHLSSEEHFEAKLHLISNEWEAPGAGLAGYRLTFDYGSSYQHVFKILG